MSEERSTEISIYAHVSISDLAWQVADASLSVDEIVELVKAIDRHYMDADLTAALHAMLTNVILEGEEDA